MLLAGEESWLKAENAFLYLSIHVCGECVLACICMWMCVCMDKPEIDTESFLYDFHPSFWDSVSRCTLKLTCWLAWLANEPGALLQTWTTTDVHHHRCEPQTCTSSSGFYVASRDPNSEPHDSTVATSLTHPCCFCEMVVIRNWLWSPHSRFKTWSHLPGAGGLVGPVNLQASIQTTESHLLHLSNVNNTGVRLGLSDAVCRKHLAQYLEQKWSAY